MEEKVKKWLENDVVWGKYYIYNGLIYVHGDVVLEHKNTPYLPCQFEHVSGGFWAAYSGMQSLNGCPKIVGGTFSCANNQLTTLEGGPKYVGADYICGRNQLTTLNGSPRRVGGEFDCRWNQLTTLKGGPKFVGVDFSCGGNLIVEEPDYSFIKIGGDIMWEKP